MQQILDSLIETEAKNKVKICDNNVLLLLDSMLNENR